MDKKIIKFCDTEKKQHRFHQQKSNNWINNIDIYKIVVSNKVSVGKNGFKHFICKDDKKLCILLPIIRASNRDFDETKYVFFDKRWWIVRKISAIRENVSNTTKKEFESEPA